MTDGKRLRKGQNLTGRTFGMLTALSPAGSNGAKLRWLYRCDCGNECVKVGADVSKDVKKGRVPNCGCMTRRILSEKRTSHGMSRHPCYAVYRSMVDRCTLPSHHAWKNYGGRGISVCPQWMTSFENFWRDMGPGYRSGLQLDRRDNGAGYWPENCRWVPCLTNSRNKRSNSTIQTPAGPMLLSEAAGLSGIGKTTLAYRVKNQWPTDRLFDRPDVRNRSRSTCGRAFRRA